MYSGIFVCYDRVQKNYFKNNGLKDVVYGIHPKTGKMFWVFLQTDEFDKVIKKWLAREH